MMRPAKIASHSLGANGLHTLAFPYICGAKQHTGSREGSGPGGIRERSLQARDLGAHGKQPLQARGLGAYGPVASCLGPGGIRERLLQAQGLGAYGNGRCRLGAWGAYGDGR